jgi:hypothetical protein
LQQDHPLPQGNVGQPSEALDPAQLQREQATLGTIEGRAKLRIKAGAVAFIVGVLLLAGLSSSPLAIAIGGVAVLGGPLLLLWGERAHQLAKQGIGIYLALIAFWFAYALVHGTGVNGAGRIVCWAGILVGLGLAWRGMRASQLLGVARTSLTGPTYDVQLEIRVRRGYGGQPHTSALIWGVDPGTPLAWFDWQMSEPEFVSMDKAPAKIFGTPVRRAVVVVSCPQAVVAGRIKRSHFGESASSESVSPLVAWLWKPRSLRVP